MRQLHIKYADAAPYRDMRKTRKKSVKKSVKKLPVDNIRYILQILYKPLLG